MEVQEEVMEVQEEAVSGLRTSGAAQRIET